MGKSAVKEALNRLLWDKRIKKEEYAIIFLSRGAPGDAETVSAQNLVRVSRDYFFFEASDGRIKAIPMHRVLKVVNIRTGEVLYEKPRRGK